ncbi:unnamed protein product [Pedinophyceae sp. YPF-701]|nr:unnamed protein product [Pedinophyceae sp. YPF-701]
MIVRGLLAVVLGLAVACQSLAASARPHHAARRRIQSMQKKKLLDDGPDYEWEERWFDTLEDNFGFQPEARTFPLRYLFNDSWWTPDDNGPIFLYAGNEGDIETFADNTGLMWELAPEFGALVVFAEHRFYGKSIPGRGRAAQLFPDDVASADSADLSLLTVEQAMADYAALSMHLKDKLDAQGSPIIVFGGSYGGMLATYMRVRYPWVFEGAVAASAPILYFSGEADGGSFYDIVSRDFAACADSIQRSWQAMEDVASSDKGSQRMLEALGICTGGKDDDGALGWRDVREWVAGVYVTLAMVNYPYPASFLGPMPAWPVSRACEAFSGTADGEDLLREVRDAVSVALNYTGSCDCECFDVEAPQPGLDVDVWEYQTCTEFVEPLEMDGENDMFWREPFVFDDWSDHCYDEFGVRPQSDRYAKMAYGGKDLRAATNILFSNGDLDPWSGGGVGVGARRRGGPGAPDDYKQLVFVEIAQGAHHLDLRAPNKHDPESVRTARDKEIAAIKSWVAGYSRPLFGGDYSHMAHWRVLLLGMGVGLSGGIIATTIVAGLVAMGHVNRDAEGEEHDALLA